MIKKVRQYRPWRWLALWAVLGGAVCAAQTTNPTIRKVSGLAADRWNFDSPLWEQGQKLSDFRVAADSGGSQTPQEATEVRLAHDGEYLCVRYTAFDRAVAKLKAAPLDEFADEFPAGDHGEIWVTANGLQVYAFDPSGNRYDAQNYDRGYYSGFRVKSRVASDRWQCIVLIPLKKLAAGSGKNLSLAFVRHFDHGAPDPERSTATGKPPTVRTTFTLE